MTVLQWWVQNPNCRVTCRIRHSQQLGLSFWIQGLMWKGDPLMHTFVTYIGFEVHCAQ